ncbi:DedA family protein [Ignatzschineria ureiclastica]|uniref:DedA family protein n=1 Tax=Ignatzschineria ureiclastica TaxID=472582 RepID=A0A2U2AD71_9GAMM|nr:DedA family protein [Ignatzschineria ureiclastica]PWD80615.1 DedA family protein [Ignatzschineria ureiclastica]GHA02196.1 membrane protein [Ignatzschineria ureiclastica]
MALSVVESLSLLALSSVTSSTILPGSSEVALVAFLHKHPDFALSAWLIATLFNTVGSMIMLFVGRIIPNHKKIKPRTEYYIRRYGSWTLLLSGMPFIGDILPIAAGWFRLNVWKASLAILIGKGVRYLIIIAFLEVAEKVI